jgi:hypothetical protein
MIWLARSRRTLEKLRFRLLGRATIKDIPGSRFQALVSTLIAQGWHQRARYTGFDAGIDYDRLVLRKGVRSLICEWDNWSEWSIEGPRRLIVAIAATQGLNVSDTSRWSDYDPPPDQA